MVANTSNTYSLPSATSGAPRAVVPYLYFQSGRVPPFLASNANSSDESSGMYRMPSAMAGDASPNRFDRRYSQTNFGVLVFGFTWAASRQTIRPSVPPS